GEALAEVGSSTRGRGDGVDLSDQRRLRKADEGFALAGEVAIDVLEKRVRGGSDLSAMACDPNDNRGTVVGPVGDFAELAMDVAAPLELWVTCKRTERLAKNLCREDTPDDLDSFQVEVGRRRRLSRDPVGPREVVVVVAAAAANCQRYRKSVPA